MNSATAILCAIIPVVEINVGHQGEKPAFNRMDYSTANAIAVKETANATRRTNV